MISIQVKNLDSILKGFSELEKSGIQKAISTSLEESAGYVLTELKSNTPVDSGRLKSSNKTKVDETEALIGPDTDVAPYATFVEYGHHTRGGGRWIAGQHYIQRTALQSAGKVIDIFRKNIQAIIK